MSRTLLVSPASALQSRGRLLDALAEAFGVRFEPEQRDASPADALVAFDDGGEASPVPRRPRFVAPARPVTADGPGAEVAFTGSQMLDARLRNRTMVDGAAGAVPPLTERPGHTVLAHGPRGALWTFENSGEVVHRVALSPRELPEGHRLKDHLRAGDHLSLLPLVHFLREVTGYAASPQLRVRATFVIDDPNLHWPSYGYVSFDRLARQAEGHGYHVAIAMPAIDGRFAHPDSVATIASSPSLSLLVHGNDHLKQELARPLSSGQAQAVVAQALRRTARFERRYGLAVERVMVPPHSACSEVFMAAMRQLGCEAVLYRGPTGSSGALVGWRTADIHLGGGLPGVHRMPLDVPDDELVLRSFLDQPLVLYGHHADLKDPDVLTIAAGRVEATGPVVWGSAGDITASNFTSIRDGSILRVTPFSRRFRVPPSPGITHMLVEAEMAGRPGDLVGVRVGEVAAAGPAGEPVQLAAPPDGGSVEVRLTSPDAIDPIAVAPPSWRPWPAVRRGLTEARDRAIPLIQR